MKEFKLSIYAPEHTVFEGNVVSLCVPAEEGYLGILADHAALIAALKPGKITGKNNLGEAFSYPFSDRGFLEVDKNNVTILLAWAKQPK